MNGAPAKPISGTCSRQAPRASGAPSRNEGHGLRRRRARPVASTSAAARTGRRITGPSPRGELETHPHRLDQEQDVGEEDGRVHAEPLHRRAPSPRAATSGVRQSSRNPIRSRIARYSGRKRPAWRMSQTGVYAVGRRRQAARNACTAGIGLPPDGLAACRLGNAVGIGRRRHDSIASVDHDPGPRLRRLAPR